jgi:hypothetical protein
LQLKKKKKKRYKRVLFFIFHFFFKKLFFTNTTTKPFHELLYYLVVLMGYTFKLQLQKEGEEAELRRLTLESRPSYEELRGLIVRIFVAKALNPDSFSIKYLDEENDLVTIGSDLELSAILKPEPHVVRLIVAPSTGPSTSTANQKQPEPTPAQESQPRGPTPTAAPAPFDLNSMFDILRAFGTVPTSAAPQQQQPQPQPFDFAPLLSMAMGAFSQFPQQAASAFRASASPSAQAQAQAQQQQQPPFDLSPIFEVLLSTASGLNSAFNPPRPVPQKPEGSPPSSSDRSTEAPGSCGSCPFGNFGGFSSFLNPTFVRSFVESQLEQSREWKEFAEKHVRNFINIHIKDNALPRLEELANMASSFVSELINDPELQRNCPWAKNFAPEQIKVYLDSLLASPIVQEIVANAYSACDNALRRQQEQQQQRPKEEESKPAPPEPTPERAEPIPEKDESDLCADMTEEEQITLLQLESMGFTNRKRILEVLRSTGCDVWETIQILGNEDDAA